MSKKTAPWDGAVVGGRVAWADVPVLFHRFDPNPEELGTREPLTGLWRGSQYPDNPRLRCHVLQQDQLDTVVRVVSDRVSLSELLSIEVPPPVVGADSPERLAAEMPPDLPSLHLGNEAHRLVVLGRDEPLRLDEGQDFLGGHGSVDGEDLELCLRFPGSARFALLPLEAVIVQVRIVISDDPRVAEILRDVLHLCLVVDGDHHRGHSRWRVTDLKKRENQKHGVHV